MFTRSSKDFDMEKTQYFKNANDYLFVKLCRKVCSWRFRNSRSLMIFWTTLFHDKFQNRVHCQKLSEILRHKVGVIILFFQLNYRQQRRRPSVTTSTHNSHSERMSERAELNTPTLVLEYHYIASMKDYEERYKKCY